MLRHVQYQSGFSLIELLVSMTIFTIVMSMATSSLLVLLDANSKSQNMQALLNDLTIAIDSMTRELRTGYNFYCGSPASEPNAGYLPLATEVQDCSSGTYMSVVEAGGTFTSSLTGSATGRIEYYYDSADETLKRRIDGTEDWVRVSSENIRITELEFIVTGTDTTVAGDNEQPSVTIFMAGEAGEVVDFDTSFVMQATVTQRPIDL